MTLVPTTGLTDSGLSGALSVAAACVPLGPGQPTGTTSAPALAPSNTPSPGGGQHPTLHSAGGRPSLQRVGFWRDQPGCSKSLLALIQGKATRGPGRCVPHTAEGRACSGLHVGSRHPRLPWRRQHSRHTAETARQGLWGAGCLKPTRGRSRGVNVGTSNPCRGRTAEPVSTHTLAGHQVTAVPFHTGKKQPPVQLRGKQGRAERGQAPRGRELGTAPCGWVSRAAQTDSRLEIFEPPNGLRKKRKASSSNPGQGASRELLREQGQGKTRNPQAQTAFMAEPDTQYDQGKCTAIRDNTSGTRCRQRDPRNTSTVHTSR